VTPPAQTAADRIADWAATLGVGGVPVATRQAATRCLVDVTGCALAGSRHPTTAVLARYAALHYAGGACTTAGAGTLGALGAALVNGVAAHVWDFDDTSYAGIVHASAAVWPAVLAAAQLADASAETLLLAFVAGVEAEYALGRALGDALYWKGWWNTGVLGGIGAAVGAGRALGIDAARLSHAVRIAASFAGGARVVLGTAAKPYGCGRAAQAGLEAALVAADGLGGPAEAFEEERGFARLFNDGAFDPAALDRLGARWALVDPGIAFKLFPACSAAQAAVEATIALLREHRLVADDIEGVHCAVTPLVAISLTFNRPRTPAEAQFSMPYAIACALLCGNLGIDQLTPARIGEAARQREMAKVTMEVNESLLGGEIGRRNAPEGAIVTLTTRDGRRLQRVLGAATGMPANPASDERLFVKFRGCARSVLDEATAETLLGRLRSLAPGLPARALLPAIAPPVA